MRTIEKRISDAVSGHTVHELATKFIESTDRASRNMDEIQSLRSQLAMRQNESAEIDELRNLLRIARQRMASMKALEVDARRYRWLRSRTAHVVHVPKPGSIKIFDGTGAALDGAIDAALRQEKAK